jgi:hypothetical protein|tara:strand:+ start:1274 stop:1573 length:300 start_codon:yes stop_codon:yes gene_type:complete
MVYKIKVKTQEEFEHRAKALDLQISEACVRGILDNLNSKKRHIHILEVTVEEDDTIFDITCDRKDFLETLEKNLIIMEKWEQYETCSEIIKAIEILKSK